MFLFLGNRLEGALQEAQEADQLVSEHEISLEKPEKRVPLQ